MLQTTHADAGEAALTRFFECCAWARRDNLPLNIMVKLVECYVVPACLYGTEFFHFSLPRMRELDRLQRRLGRFLLRSPHAPNSVIFGDLDWQPWSSLALTRACRLLCRLDAAPATRLSSSLVLQSRTFTDSWAGRTTAALRQLGIPCPLDSGVTPGCASELRYLYTRFEAAPRIAAVDFCNWRASVTTCQDSDLSMYGHCMARPGLASAHSWCINPRFAAAWGRLRSGCNSVSGHRSRRHVVGCSTCNLCGCADGSTSHAILECPALQSARLRWQSRVGPSTGVPARSLLRWFFSADLPPRLAAANAAFAWAIETAYNYNG